MELTKAVDVSFVNSFVETHWINSGEWESLKTILTDTQAATFTLEGKTFLKKDVKSVAIDGFGIQFFSNQDTNEPLTKSFVW